MPSVPRMTSSNFSRYLPSDPPSGLPRDGARVGFRVAITLWALTIVYVFYYIKNWTGR